jgi:predicted DNA-binding protein (UPF0251 family)
MSELHISAIDLDELEAMRLVDAEGLSQVAAAKCMKISQSTIARLLASGRKKAAHALAHGQALQLQPGAAPLNYNREAAGGMPPHGRRRGRHGRQNGPY